MTTETQSSTSSTVLKEIVSGGPFRAFLSVLLGFIVGALFMVFSNEAFLQAITYFTARPGDALGAAGTAISDGYLALFRGSIYNYQADNLVAALRPLTETLRFAGPLIAAGLGVALGFRVGLFNIGASGQILFGALAATWASTRISLPWGVHLVVAAVVAIGASAAYGAIVGYLKARTGAHEVIVTIMLNYVAAGLLTFAFRQDYLLLEANGGGTPKSDAPAETAQLPTLFGDAYTLHAGFILAVVAVIVYWWLMERSTIGFRFRMVGHNLDAARTAGINVNRTFVYAMAASGAFVGVAAVNQALGARAGLTPDLDGTIGFDAITVALLGSSTGPGVLLAGLLFGAFKAGAPAMQVIGLSPEVTGVVQGFIVLFIAAPPLVRAIFRLPAPQKTTVITDWWAKLRRKGGAK
ncbi:MAG: ABC transporter permease [Microbacteriaceae bacterium]